MQYSEFKTSCEKRGIVAPSEFEYTNIIEPVYNWHSVFNIPEAKRLCVDLYAAYGIPAFIFLREKADEEMFKAREIAERKRLAERLSRAFRNMEVVCNA